MDVHRSKSISKTFSLLSLVAALALILAACAPAATPTPSVSTEATVTIDVATHPTLGKILVGETGKTLYVFTKDTPDTVNCDAACQANWPPLVSSTTPKVGPGIDASLVGSATLPTGETVITYNHMPLYYFIKDTQPGQVTGQDVGGVWYVISPDGKIIEPPSTTAPTAVPTAAASSPTLMVAADPNLGKILVDGKGMTLYIFTKDGPDQSNCSDSCLTNWPPLLTTGTAIAGNGVDDSLIGTTALPSGDMIVTYNHMPLYYFAKDTKSGQTSGQDVGSVWFVVSPDGKIIGHTGSTAPTVEPAAVATVPTLMVATDPKLGEILVDGKGMTLYIFTNDGPDQSNCSGSCLTNWPPLLTQGTPSLGTGVDDSKIGTALLADGARIATYNHMPLYYFIKDTKPGDTSGQGVGGVWYVVNRDGEIVGK